MDRLMVEYYGGKFVPRKMCTVGCDGFVDDCDACFEQCFEQCNEDYVPDDMCGGCPIQECFDRLAEYEATNLAPEQIMEMDKLYRELSKEVMQYRKIGSVEECRKAVGRHESKKVLKKYPVGKFEIGNCPSCHMAETSIADYCGSCGQRLDWRDAE